MKNIYLAIEIKENGKYYAFAETIRTGENLIPFIKRYQSDITHLCKTRKQAEEIVTQWNAVYKANGTYLFDYPIF